MEQTAGDISHGMKTFDELESEVRSYCRNFPTIFSKARGERMWDVDGKEYIDFFAGAGALNYGHNNSKLKNKLIKYISEDNIVHGLDMATVAKERFLETFNETILEPRKMDYRVMFPGPTGTNSVESALKLARKVAERDLVMCFTNAFHGMTLGSLSVTGNSFKREGAGIPLGNSVAMPYCNYMDDDMDTIDYIERFLDDNGSGVAFPAAIILETVQGEGGLNVASYKWMRKIEDLCQRWDILFIVDDIQVGCGRTGTFFSFELAGISPDIVCLSKSISGYGLPMALTLIKPEHDQWEPGEHNGTFRGNNLAFVTAAETMDYWKDDSFSKEIAKKSERVSAFLNQMVMKYPDLKGEVRGRGLMQGIACQPEDIAGKICSNAFNNGLIMETSGVDNEVFKIMPPLNIEDKYLEKGFDIIDKSIKQTIKSK